MDSLNWLPAGSITRCFSLTSDSQYLYVGSSNSTANIARINVTNSIVDKNWSPSVSMWVWGITVCLGNLYVCGDGISIYRINLTNPLDINPNFYYIGTTGIAKGISQYNGNLFVSLTNPGRIIKIITQTQTIDTSWGASGIVNISSNPYTSYVYNHKLYLMMENGNLSYINLQNTTDICANLLPNRPANTDTHIYIGLCGYGKYLYYGYYPGVNTYRGVVRVNLSQLTDISYTFKIVNYNDLQGMTVNSTDNYLYWGRNLDGGMVRLVLLRITDPPTTPTILSAISTFSGKLTVTIIDTENTSGVSYLYSTNNTVYGNSNVINNGNPTYNFTISNTGNTSVLLTDISYTLYVTAKNTYGCSSPASASVVVYVTPQNIINCSVSSHNNGNINVSITETSPVTYYYLNNVSYLYYLYTTGTNQSSNILAYTIGANLTASSYTTNFVIPNIPQNNYRIYLIATNSVGNTIANTRVFEPPSPISFDTGNTSIITPGNLKVTINDPTNRVANDVYYYYSIDGGTNYANSNVPNNGPTKTSYTFYIPYNSTAIQTIYVRAQNYLGNSNMIGVNVNSPFNTSLYATTNRVFIDNYTNYTFPLTGFPNKTYNLYLRGKNTLGYSANSTPYSVTVFVTPNNSINIVAGNTRTVAGGNLQVQITDLSNTALNGVYYWYSLNSSNDYRIDGVTNGDISLIRGNTYNLIINATGHPFWIQTVQGEYSSNAIYTSGVSNNGTQNGTITFVVPNDAPNTLYYVSQYYSNMQGRILITDPVVSISTIHISNSGSGAYTINGVTNGDISLIRGRTYSLVINATGHPFWIQTVPGGYSSTNIYSSGVTNNGYQNGTITFVVPINAPDTLYYACEYHSSMQGRILITDPVVSISTIHISNSGSATSFANTFVRANVSPYTFFIPSITDISNTLYVRASNTVGNSSPAANLQVLVFQTPTTPGQVQLQLMSSGNVQVTITETSPMPYYYLNNVSYYLYAYNTFGGNNLSGNTSLAVYNRSVGVLANTNSTYGNVVSYVNTGLNANTYTMYVIARSDFGNSNPVSANITVYTTPDFPPKFDTGNTVSATAGNLTVSFTDPSNNTRNAISYVYYVLDPSSTNNSGNLAFYTNTNLTLTTGTHQSFSVNGTGLINKTYTVYLRSTNVVGTSGASFANVLVYTVPTDISIDLDNTFSISSGNLQVTVIDPNNGTNNGVYYQYLVTGGNTYVNATNTQIIDSTKRQFIIPNLPNGSFAINVLARNTVGNSNPTTFTQVSYVNPDGVPVIDQANTLSQTSGNLTVSLIDTTNNYLNNVTYYYYLYDVSAGGTNYYANTVYYTTSSTKLIDGQTQYSFPITSGLGNKTYTLYLRAKNNVGWSGNSAPYTVKTYTTPTPTVYFDTGNTKTVASGNLQVVLRDPSNIAFNGVSYMYSINGITYVRSNVNAGTLPYTFYIAPTNPPLDISNTIYVRATNQVGNSSPDAVLTVVVYQTPRTPSSVQFELLSSGNVRVTIAETPVSRPDYYYLNNVSYSLYAYNTFGGTNLSGNTSLAVYNRSVGVLANTNSTYDNVVSYVSTGLNANTYTMYVIATNPFGNSNSFSANVVVYTTPDFPPKIDAGNTISATAGNLTVSFTDLSNNTRNAISYVYYVYDPDSGTNDSGNLVVYSNSNTTLTTGVNQSFTIYGYTNKTYTLYLRSTNAVGYSPTASSTNVTVYTVPTDIVIDTANVKTVASGNLQVVLVDPSNGTNNGVYYQYSVISVNGNAWTNANAERIGSSTSYQFYIGAGLMNQTYTINVRAQNTVGNSNANTFVKTVYITPQYPPTIDTANTLSTSSGNLTISFTDTENAVINDISYSYYLFDVSSGETNQWANTLAYIESPNKLVDGQMQFQFDLSGFPNKTYALYLRSKNSIGYSANTAPYNVTVFTTPTSTVSYDAGNTKTVASGNLQVALIDLSNTSLNQVYYWYSTTTDEIESYSNSYVKSGVLPYVFYISPPVNSLLDISSTIYVKAINTVGESSPSTSKQVVVYRTPFTPADVQFVLVQSGNVRVTITESPESLPNYYYLNDVSYYLYAYNQNSDDNMNANIVAYTYPVGVLTNTNTTYEPIVSYVSTGLTANTYSMYVIAKNDFESSSPYSTNIDVYTTPLRPSINTQTTISATSGNLTVAFTDTVNNVYNGIEYLYYVYDPSSGLNESGNVQAYTNSGKTLQSGVTAQSFDIYGYVNKIYTLYLLAKNPIGTSVTDSTNVIVYTTPLTPTYYDIGNTRTVASGNLQVTFYDTANQPLNNVYYWYSADDGYTYSPTYLQNTGTTDPYVFFISPLTNILTNISIISTDPVGNSLPLSQTFVVLQTPRTPPSITATLIQSGNVLLTIRESASIPPPNYYLNNVAYYYYLYTEGTGTNDSGNLSAYTNYIGSATDSNYSNISIYVTGLPNKTSTFYVMAINEVGNSAPQSADITVYVAPDTPPAIDDGNTFSIASGNLQVRLIDNTNTASNDVYYWYSLDGGNTYVPTNIKSNGPTTSSYTFYVPDLSNQDYTISVIAKNTVGSSQANTITKRVYITPQFAPVIDRVNTGSYLANYMAVSFDDTRNNSTNNISYLYYLYDKSTSTENNLYGNIAYYKESTTSLLLDGTTKYSFDISGLVNTTYTLYLLSKNTVSISSTDSTDVVVYTVPAIPTIDVSNTLSVASGNVQVVIIDTSNVALNNVYYWYSNDGGNTYANTGIKTAGPSSSPYVFYVSGLLNTTYTWLIMAKNTVGNAVSSSLDVLSYTKPFPVSFDAGNTLSVSSGNLQVSLLDSSNISLNEVYYHYSIDGGNTYSNTGIKNVGPSGSPYVFWIPDLSNQPYSVSVKGVNRIDESIVSTITKTVYITPEYSPVFDLGNTISATSGNLTVVFDDTNNLPINDIQYWYYLYDPSNNTNESMNPGAYTYTATSLDTNGFGPTRFSFELSNLTNKIYTIYLLSKNTVGYSAIHAYANTIVYTKPVNSPIIDTANTRTAETGNLLVSFTDSINESLNDIYYWYSTDGGILYANSLVKNAGPDQTSYSFYISGLTNSNTTLSIYSKNTVGNSSPLTETIQVYTTPLVIQTIQSGNTKTVASGNLQVSFVDTTNVATNDVYYWYSTYSTVDGESTYANSFVKNAGPTKSTYMFYINGLTNAHTAISIKSRNSTDLYIGESATVGSNVIVYTTPEQLSSYSVLFLVSGTIQIDVVDPNNSPTNEVYYYVYYYRTEDTGPNNSINISLYSNTYVKRIATSTNATFYLNDLLNGEYTVYVATRNEFGSNLFSPVVYPIQVYTRPIVPVIDNANTLSKSSGNLTVSIVDTVNSSTNAVYYWYSINGGTYENTGISKLSGVTQYSYDIPTTQISNGNVYVVRMKTVNPAGDSVGVATSNPVEVYTTPEIPVLYSVVSQNASIDIAFSSTYNNGNAISRYEYILNNTTIGILNTTFINFQNTARISGLINGTTYSVAVRAVNARGPSGWSSTQSAVPFGVPSIPDVNVVSGDSSVDIYFTTPNNNGNTITRYEYSLYGGSAPINTIELASNNHYTVIGLTNGITYNVAVRAVNARGAGDWSTPVSATPYTNPNAPIVKLESLSGAFRIYFDTPYNGGVPITHYQYTLNGGDSFTQFMVTDSSNSFIVSGVDGTPYTVSVRTFNANNRNSVWSAPATIVPFSVPLSPILRTADAGIGAIPITFSASTYNGGNTISRYEYSTNAGNSFVTMGLPTTVNANGYITYEITYQSTGSGNTPLVNGTSYTIQLRAVNARGPSTSPSGSITVIPFNLPDPPTLLSATPNNSIIDVAFSAPASDGGNPIVGYEYSINGGTSYATVNNIDITAQQLQFTVTGLENGNVFSVSVRSRNSRGVSNPSNTIEAIPFGIPDPPIISGVSKNTRLDIGFDTPNNRGKPIVGYEYLITPGARTYKRISSILPVNDNSQNVFTIYGLTNGQTYSVNVRSVNSVGISANVSNNLVIVPSTTPEAPTINAAVSLPGAIDIVFNTVTNTGGNTITGYKYAYYLGGV